MNAKQRSKSDKSKRKLQKRNKRVKKLLVEKEERIDAGRSRADNIRTLSAASVLENKLILSGYSGSSGNVKTLMKAHNRKFGTQFKHVNEVLKYYRIYI